MSDTLTLGFDTSAAHCAAALVLGDRVLAQVHQDMTKGQAERLMPLLEEILQDNDLSWRDLSRIGVGIGPGNFTGIRIAVSAARGLALSLGVPAIGVSALQAQAFGLKRPVVSTLDARRGAVYLQVFDTSDTAPAITTLSELPALAATTPNCVGFGAEETAARYGGTPVQPAVSIGAAIALIAAACDPLPTSRPAPLYLRGADAAPPRDRAPAILPNS